MHWKKYIAELFTISLPIMLGNVGHTLIGATDVWIAAKHSVNTLASIAIANAILFTIFFIGIGLLSGISIILANRRGAKETTKKYFLSGVVLSQVLAFITLIFLIIITKFVPFMGFSEELIPTIQQYMYVTSFSIFGMYLYQAIKEFLLAYEIVNFPNIVVLISVVVNAFLNYFLVFGFGNFEGLGSLGLAVATLIVRLFMGLCMLVYVLKLFKRKRKEPLFDITYVKQVLKIGAPIGVAIFLEFLAFNLVTIRVGMDKGLLSAVHNILITLVDTVYMVPLSIATAMSIKIGFYNGAGNKQEIKRYSIAGLIMATLFMSCCSLAFFLKPEFFIGIFSKDKVIFDIAINIVPIFSIFVIADGLQVSLGGILKGLKMTKAVSACILSSYWIIGVPLGFFLAYKANLSLLGFWIALMIAVGAIAFSETTVIIFKLMKKKINS